MLLCVKITCAPVLVRGWFIAGVTHTPVGVLGGLAASVGTQIGKQPALIPTKFSSFFTKLRMCFCKMKLRF